VSRAHSTKPRRTQPSTSSPERVRQEALTLHGNRVSYRTAGSGPVVALIHGVACSSAMWGPAMTALAADHTVVAPDLLGHGHSAKPRTDYSIGAQACLIRDLLVALDHEHATIVGHSLGGGIAMQFAYQFPERCERLVLVSSGGLGSEVMPLLRAATLPGTGLVLPLIAHRRLTGALFAGLRNLERLGVPAGPEVAELARCYMSLRDAQTRRAFLATVRSVIDGRGQRVSARDRLYLSATMPSLIIWGTRDLVLPVAHAEQTHRAMPGSRLEVFKGAGHLPHLADPDRFAAVVGEFIAGTEAAAHDWRVYRKLILGAAG
jgi:pimeloyl-ACP methyl ester carboxylesterase